MCNTMSDINHHELPVVKNTSAGFLEMTQLVHHELFLRNLPKQTCHSLIEAGITKKTIKNK